jgi:hypothetical protein
MTRVGVCFALMVLALSNGYGAVGGFERVGSVPADVTAVSVYDGVVYAASGNDVYSCSPAQTQFRQLISIKGEDVSIHYLLGTSEGLLIAASDGLYRLASDAGSPEILWRRQHGEEGWSSVNHVLVDGDRVYLSTDTGLYVRMEGKSGFVRMDALPGETAVYWIERIGSRTNICATSRGVYRFADNGQDLRRVFGVRDVIDEDMSGANVPRNILLREPEVWVGTDDGLLYSSDDGESFARAYLPRIMNAGINGLTEVGDNIIFVATDNGGFLIDPEGNVSLVEGSSAVGEIRAATLTEEGLLYLATNNGLYKGISGAGLDLASAPTVLNVRLPDIKAVQEVAMRYNDVHPDTIKSWRRRANYQALFPTLSLDYDKSLWGDKDGKCYVGPNDWGIGFSWDIGDLIFNDKQTSIDTRSKLKTQLRADILDEVNRLYFEYKRTLLELRGTLAAGEHEEKELHLEQLAASLDAYTGGFFTRSLHNCP